MDWLPEFARPVAGLPYASTWLPLLGLLLAAWLANWITRRILLKVVARVAQASPLHWDDALMARGVLSRLAHVVPALIIGVGILGIPDLPETAVAVVHNVAVAYIYLTVALSLGNLFNALNDLYERRGDRARQRPIKGYLQVAKLVVFLIAGVLVVATLIDRSPLVLLTGLGAMTAVVLLVF